MLRYVDILALAVKAPRTTLELSELSGLNKQSVRNLMNAMEAEGLVAKERIGGPEFNWTWVRP